MASARKKSRGRRYGDASSTKVEKALHEMKRGQLRSGASGKRVKSRKQAIAIGLSEARRAGGKVPPARSGRRRRTRGEPREARGGEDGGLAHPARGRPALAPKNRVRETA
jgi:hypothetical protein